MATWRDGSSVARSPSEVEAACAALLHASQHAPGGTDPVLGIVAADIDSAIQFWDDPLGIGFAAPFLPGTLSNQATMNANRASFVRCISGGVVNFIRMHVFTQSGNICIAIYANTGSGAAARPGARRWTSGSIACPAGASTITVSPGLTVKARQDWFGFVCDNGTASFYTFNQPQQTQEFSAGWAAYKDSAFPLPDPAGAVNNGGFRCASMAGRAT